MSNKHVHPAFKGVLEAASGETLTSNQLCASTEMVTKVETLINLASRPEVDVMDVLHARNEVFHLFDSLILERDRARQNRHVCERAMDCQRMREALERIANGAGRNWYYESTKALTGAAVETTGEQT